MRLAFVLPVLALLGVAWVPTTASQACPRLVIKAKARPNAKRGVFAGKMAKVTVVVRNRGPVDDLAFKMNLPAGLSLVKTESRPSPKVGSEPDTVQNPDGTMAIYWTDIDITRKGNSKRSYGAMVLVDACAPETLAVTALTYLVNATDSSGFCAKPLPEPVILRVKYADAKTFRSRKHGSSRPVTCAPTPAPSVNPAVPFVPYGFGQRCLEAGRLAPFSDRRLSARDNSEGGLDMISDTYNEYRHLAPVGIVGPVDCFNYCSVNGNVPTPFFFNWNTETNQCFCCGQVCTLILDPDFDSYKVVEAATAAPTALPTKSPSASPTDLPSASPSASPSATPSSTPTQLPSQSPSSSPSASPSATPSSTPTQLPSQSPSSSPSASPSATPSLAPTGTAAPTNTGDTLSPTASPSASPSATPSSTPTQLPSQSPSSSPSASPSATPSSTPTGTPTSRPTTSPTQAPTRACSFGEFRDLVTGNCVPCEAGTYWNQSTQTTACLECPSNQTSLQGATQCYTPCPELTALNTTDLTCVPIPQNLVNITQGNTTVNLNTSDVFIVELPSSFQDTLGRADNTSNLNTTDPGAAIVIVLPPDGVFPVPDNTVIRVPVVLFGDPGVSTGRRLQTDNRPLITAFSGLRHFIVDSTTLTADGVVLQGAINAAYSGGLEFVGTNPVGQLSRTTFRSCRWAGNGGAVLLGGSGAQCFVQTGCSFLDNSALAGAGIYAGIGSTLTVSKAVSFINNSAPQTSLTSGGGGGIYLNNAQLTLGSDVSFDANINDDITSVSSTVSCLNASYSSSCSGGCTGSYNVPTSCQFCSSSTSDSVCNTCPKGTYGGAEAELPCQLCPYGQTTVFPPSSTSFSACVDITKSPTSVPTAVPTRVPSSAPTVVPTKVPSSAPTVVPTGAPSLAPTVVPTSGPSFVPTVVPTSAPTVVPTSAPSSAPTVVPTSAPTLVPTKAPSSRPTTAAPSQSPTQSPTALYPLVRVENVTSLDTSAFPPPDVWATTQNSFNSLQSISPAPSPYSCSLRQETFNNPSKATAGISWEQTGMFNGMLFRNFVLEGFQLFYNYFVLVTPAGQQNIYAPDIRIQTRSPVTGRYADFIWNPYNNQGSQGPVAYQNWKGNNITQTTGSNEPWPVGPTGGEGWTCTLNCYLPVNSTENATNTSRNLFTYVQALLDQDNNTQAYVSINSAIITGLQVVLGDDEPNSVSFTHDVSVRSGAYNWAWGFNC